MLVEAEVKTPDVKSDAKFAWPSKSIFAEDRQVGAIYTWTDGSETEVWFGEVPPRNACTVRSSLGYPNGWRDFFLSLKAL